MQNRVFFPQRLLDGWIVAGSVDLRGDELTILAAGRRYTLVEAVRVLREVGAGSDEASTGSGGDPHRLTGRVKAHAVVDAIGAEIVETSMLIGDAAYDVEPGWLGAPVGSFAEHLRASGGGQGSGQAPPGRGSPAGSSVRGAVKTGQASQTDEELLKGLL